MRKILLPLFAVLIITACKKETVSEQPKPQEEIATAAAAKGSDKITIWHYNATNNTWKQTNINANALPEHQAHGDIWKVGQNYKGGKIGYILQAGDPGYDVNVPHGLIAAENDLLVDRYGGPSPRANWYVPLLGDGLPEEYWQVGPSGRGTAIGTGMANTNAAVPLITNMVNWFFANYASPSVGYNWYPTSACYNLESNGYTDWFLPSIDELKKIMINREIIGGFATPEFDYSSNDIRAIYWSSTEYGPVEINDGYLYLFAQTCYFRENTPSNSILTSTGWDSGRIRPVRYF